MNKFVSSLSGCVLLLVIALVTIQCSTDAVSSFNQDGDSDVPIYKPEDGDVAVDGDDNFLPDGDVAIDGDTLVDGDVVVDGDTLPDGDVVVDGDILPDGDVVVDGDDVPDGDIADGDSEEEWKCSNDGECPFGHICISDAAGDGCVSVNECTTDGECEEGYVCQSNGSYFKCVLDGLYCQEDSDCDFGFSCSGVECKYANECEDNGDCASGYACIDGVQWKICVVDNSECQIHTDCDFNYMCQNTELPYMCSYASTCTTDADCSYLQSCEVVENWKECKTGIPTVCQSDEDCAPGEYCEIAVAGYGSCKSLNQCASDIECPDGFACEFNDTFYECVEVIPCVTDTDCSFGFKCIQASPRNYCEYANECSGDSDCAALQECKVEGNWTVCKAAWNGVCTKDENCPADEYCDLELGPIGECRSRSQCFVDEDCDEGLVCESNGEWNMCVPGSSEACWFDFQCPEDWQCTDGQCKPTYEGMCENIEGRWTVIFSPPSCVMTPIGTVYEFIPKDGCNGDVKPSLSTIDLGTFKETSTSHYDVVFGFVYKCTANVTLASVLSMDCPVGCAGIQFARF